MLIFPVVLAIIVVPVRIAIRAVLGNIVTLVNLTVLDFLCVFVPQFLVLAVGGIGSC